MRAEPALWVEQEVEAGRYWRRLRAAWWLVALAVVLGVAAGYLVSLGAGTLYEATATVYLGQPLSPSGGSQIQGLATNPTFVNQYVKSPATVRGVASELNLSPGRLRQGISTKTVAGVVARQGQTPLVEVSVRGPWLEQSAQAANLLAERAVTEVSGYVLVKSDALREQLEGQGRELAEIERRVDRLQSAIDAGGLSSLEQLLLTLQAGNAEQRRGQLVNERTETRQLLTLAENVERARVVARAVPAQVEARGAKSSMLVGGLIGLIAGAALALIWQPLAERRRDHA